MNIITLSKTSGKNRILEQFIKRPPIAEEADRVARKVLRSIQREGNKALLRYAKQFDGAALTARTIRVSPAEVAEACKQIDPIFKKAAGESLTRITRFAKAGMKKDWSIATEHKGYVGEQYTAIERVGIYIPGGAAPLVSTVLMTAGFANVAGVPEIVACTPADQHSHVNPYILYALSLCGVHEVYKVGGIQAIGAMAYGTETIRPVQKIVGPGGPYVTAAKKLVYGHVSLDMVAGPSEIAVCADDSADPVLVAIDLLSQAEHGTGHEKALLVTTSAELAEEVKKAVAAISQTLNRLEAVQQVLDSGMLFVVTPDMETAIDICNRFAPEHMELMCRRPEQWRKKVKTAGALFIGKWTPEAAGDFIAGPSHVLPTGGTAAFFSGLTVDDFRRKTSVVKFTKGDLTDTVEAIDAFGRVETLKAHAQSGTLRFS